MFTMKKLASFISLLTVVLFLGSYALSSDETDEQQKSSSVPIINIPKPYTDKMTDQLDSTGFRNGWIDYDGIQKYDKIMLYVILSKTQIKSSGTAELSTERLASSKEEDDKYVVDYAKDKLGSAFAGSSEFQMVSDRGTGTLAVVFYITQIVPGDAVTGTLGNIPSPTWIITKPLGMGAHAASDNAGGAIAMETIIIDSQTKKILAVFSSREKGTNAVINTKNFSAYGNVKQIIEIWSKNLISTLDKVKSGQKDLQADYKLDSVSIIN